MTQCITTRIHTEYIQLDQLLKLEGIIGTGGQIKKLLEAQAILVNHVRCQEKRKKIRPHDVVEVVDVATITVVSEEV